MKMRFALMVMICAELVLCGNVHPEALATGKATDRSICDLAPYTTELISRRTFLPAGGPRDLESEAYFRLAGTFVAERCANGQVLVLSSRSGNWLDEEVLSRLANSACVAADVARSETSVQSAEIGVRHGYELRCHVAKVNTLKEELARLEEAEPTSSIVARMQATRHDAAASANKPSSSNRDCSKMTVTSMLFGGGPCH